MQESERSFPGLQWVRGASMTVVHPSLKAGSPKIRGDSDIRQMREVREVCNFVFGDKDPPNESGDNSSERVDSKQKANPRQNEGRK